MNSIYRTEKWYLSLRRLEIMPRNLDYKCRSRIPPLVLGSPMESLLCLLPLFSLLVSLPSKLLLILSMRLLALIKKKKKNLLIKYIRIFRWDRLQSHIHLCLSSYIRKPFLIYDFETPYINFLIYEENFVFFFISEPAWSTARYGLSPPWSAGSSVNTMKSFCSVKKTYKGDTSCSVSWRQVPSRTEEPLYYTILCFKYENARWLTPHDSQTGSIKGRKKRRTPPVPLG